MLTYMWTRIFCGATAIASFAIAAFLNCYGKCDFWCNTMLGIFGSSFLAWLGALIAYKITRREAIMEYLASLRTYRRKFKYLISAIYAKPGSNHLQERESLADCFDEWLAVYSKTGHICKPLCKYRMVPKTLDKSFQLIVDVQGNMNCNHTEYDSYSKDIDKAIYLIENLARNKGYLHTVKKEKNDGQAENGDS